MSDSISPLWVVQILAMQLALFLALLLAAAAVHKAAWPLRPRRALHEMTGVPMAHAAWVLWTVCGIEGLAAGLLLLPGYRSAGALLAGGVWSAYVVAMLRTLRGGAVGVDCGCSFGATHRPLGHRQVLRNLWLLFLSACVALVAVASPPVSAVGGGAGLIVCEGVGAVALLACYAALDHALVLQPPRTGEAA